MNNDKILSGSNIIDNTGVNKIFIIMLKKFISYDVQIVMGIDTKNATTAIQDIFTTFLLLLIQKILKNKDIIYEQIKPIS